MSDLQTCLDAMAAAEQEADFNARFDDTQNSRWARDRIALVARDRATLERHAPNLSGLRGQLPEAEQTCIGCTFGGSTRWLPDCHERNAVIDYWTRDA